MKTYLLLFFFVFISCVPLKTTVDSPRDVASSQVLLHLKIDQWSSEQSSEHVIQEEEQRVTSGQTFGPEKIMGIEQPPFKLLSIIDNNTLMVQFDEGLTILGQPVSRPYPDNPITFSDAIC